MNKRSKQSLVSSRRESGAALIVVLSFLVLLGLITAAVVQVSQLSSRKLSNNADRGFSAYLAEGAAARLQWIMMAYKIKYPSTGDQSIPENMDQPQFLYSACGRKVSLKYYDATINFYIFDMASGFNVSGGTPAQGLDPMRNIFLFDPDKSAKFITLLDRISDYVNPNRETKSANGLSRADYTNMGMFPLPRGDKLDFREELLWIPGVSGLFTVDDWGMLSTFNIIPPDGLFFSSNQCNFFSATKELLMSKCNFTDQEATDIVNARNNWMRSGANTSLYNYISNEIIARIKQQFSFGDSGYYTLIVNASQGSGSMSKTVIVSLKITQSITNGNEYFQYLLY
jgi:hypothetical protein